MFIKKIAIQVAGLHKEQQRNILFYCSTLSIVVVLQACHYVFYYKQGISISLVWSLVDWNIWFLMFGLIYRFKQQNGSITQGTYKRLRFLVLLCVSFPIVHIIISNLVFLLLFEPSRTFLNDLLHQLSKRWFLNIFIVLGLNELFTFYYMRFLNRTLPDQLQKEPLHSIIIKDGTASYQISPSEIEWAESAKNYVILCLLSGEQVLSRKTIASTYESLKDYGFIRISRSVIVNKQSVHAIAKRTKYSFSIVTKSSKTFPVGKTFLKDVRGKFEA